MSPARCLHACLPSLQPGLEQSANSCCCCTQRVMHVFSLVRTGQQPRLKDRKLSAAVRSGLVHVHLTWVRRTRTVAGQTSMYSCQVH